MGKEKRRRSESSSPERSRKRRSRSKERHKKSKDRKKSRSRERKRSRSRERKSEKRRRSRSRSFEIILTGRELRRQQERKERETSSRGRESRGLSQDAGDRGDNSGDEASALDKDKEQARLELEMTRRRERIEKWRAEKRKKELENAAAADTAAAKEEEEKKVVKKWSLEEDGDEEEEEEGGEDGEKKEGDGGEEADDELDPLDAYMSEVTKEVRKIKGGINPKNAKMLKAQKAKKDGKNGDTISNGDSDKPAEKKKMVLVTGVAKKTREPKPDFIEQNQDGLEYSSEEESKTLEEIKANLEKKKKEVVVTDHAAMNYPPFRKDFYCEVPEITKMTDLEVEEYRASLEGIKCKGKNVPRPIKNWVQCGVSAKILHLLKKYNYDKPTPIQAQAMPVIMSGRDAIGIAKTGSGKTLAFLLPLFRHIADQDPLEENDGPIAIIMTPTRELCLQIGKECRKFIKAVGGARVVCVYGGTGISEQIAELKRGAEIIVCTPGRMIDMLAANSGKVTNLRRITMMILDEADRMFDMGFEPQVMRVLDNCRPDRQTVMFSATFPRAMEALARRILIKPVEVQVGGRSVVSNEIEQHVWVVEEDGKFLKLLEVVGNYIHLGSVLVFVDKQEHADGLLKDLMNAGYSSCASLHGGIDQYDRDSTIVDFKNGKTQILVATSVCARGLDVKNLVLVVNYDCPNHYEDYVHRVGRTGRAGNEGFAFTFITKEQDWYSGDVIKALELSGSLVPQNLREMFEGFKLRMAQEGKKVKSSGGFGGTGFKFDETEATYTSEKKKYQKAALGLQDSDEDDHEQEIDAQIENLLSAKRTVKAMDGTSTTPATMGVNGKKDHVPVPMDKLAMAKQMAAKLTAKTATINKSEVEKTTEGFVRGTGGAPGQSFSAKSVADQLAARLNAKLNYVPGEGGEPLLRPVEEGGIFQKYEEELEINDFPQQARWKVTSKEALAQISEYSEAGITVRGTYYAPGKPVAEGERKLYLAIESTAELSVQKAKVEITRLLKEELLKLNTSAIHHINKGRYAVL